MKFNLNKYFFIAALAILATSCVSDDDTELPQYEPLVMGQDFNAGADEAPVSIPGWINYAESGNALWTMQFFRGNGYAEFSAFQSGDVSNIGWLISPAFTLPEEHSRVLRFQASQSFVSTSANSLEVLISTDFNGTDVTSATWIPVSANLPGPTAEYFLFFDSGLVDLSAFSGNVHVAFKYTGSGTNNALDGSYQIDNVRVY